MNEPKYIETIQELEKYKGKVVMFYYTINNSKKEKPQYMWAKKITKIIPCTGNQKTIVSANIYGTNCVVFFDNGMYINKPPRLEYSVERMSNAQQFARELTITEKIIYRRLIKKEEYKQKMGII